MRQRDLPLYLSGDPPGLFFAPVGDVDVAPIAGMARISFPGNYLLVAISLVRGGFWGFPPDGFTFYLENGTTGEPDTTTPVTPIVLAQRAYIGVGGSAFGPDNAYSYVYLVPRPEAIPPTPNPRVFYEPVDGVGSDAFAVTYLGIGGLAETTAGHTDTLSTPATTFSFPARTDGLSAGRWVFVGLPASDGGTASFTPTPLPTPADNGIQPVIVDAGAGPTSAAAAAVETAATATMLGVWFQALAVPVPAVVPLPATTVVTNTFTATIGTIGGATRTLPAATAVNTFTADITIPAASTDWWCVLVDADGNTIARMPDAVIGDIGETLNDITGCTITVPIRSTAGTIIDQTDLCAGLEVQVWRGNTLWLWGPIVTPTVDGGSFRLAVKDAPWHLTQRHIGKLGNHFGGVPPYYHDPITNERFEAGDLSGWSIFRTISIGEYVGFGTPDPTAIVVAPDRHLPGGQPMARCTSPLDPLDNYQLYQDLSISGPQNGRPLTVTLSGWWYIPSTGGYAPNNQRMGLLLATLLDDADLPGDYYRPQDWSFTTLDDTIERDTLVYQQCELELPPGVPTTVHVSVCFPQGVSYFGGLDLQVDDGLLYNESPTTIGAGLVMHAQDPEFDKDDVNLGWWANTLGDKEIREYLFSDHTNCYQAITTMAREGWYDWHTSYTATGRVMNFTTRRRGGYKPAAVIRMDAAGHGNVATLERQRTTGATAVAAQTRTNGTHERGSVTAGVLTLEEVFVADREPRDYDLDRLAAERVGLTLRPEVVQATTNPGDERFLLGLAVGDTTDITSVCPGSLAAGRYRLTARKVDPSKDSAVLTFHPEAS